MTVAQELDQKVEGKTVSDYFAQTVADHGHLTALRWKTPDGGWAEMTYDEMADRVGRAAAGLLDLGVDRGDRVMLMMLNRPEFHVLDTAALMLGATVVSIYNSSSPDQIEYLCNDAEAKVAIAGNAEFLRRFNEARPALKTLEKVGVVDTADAGEHDFSYGDLMNHDPMAMDDLVGRAKPDDLITLIYTSGTTGPSKGVMLDHRNIVWTGESMRAQMEFDEPAGMRLVSYLPMAHIAERMVSHYQTLMFGYEITTCPDPTQFAAYAGEVHPNVMFGVPRVWEKIYSGVQAALSADPEKAQKFNEGVAAAMPIAEKMTMGTATDEEKETYEFLDAVAFAPVRQLVGLDQLEAAITGAAPLPAEMMSWFRAIGVPLSEVYGLSETTGPMTWEPYRVKSGYVGVACPGVEVKLDGDGEVMCRGGNVFRGYLNQPEKTAEVLDEEGWFRSGDIGEFDDDGYLKIVDRKKELIITAGGKNISPANLEAALKMIPLVGQAIAIGDQRPFVSALVVLDPDIAPGWADANGIAYDDPADLATKPEVVAEIEGGLAAVMEPFNNAEKVKKLVVLGEEWMPDSELLTPTSKLKRRGIHARFASEIEAIYTK